MKCSNVMFFTIPPPTSGPAQHLIRAPFWALDILTFLYPCNRKRTKLAWYEHAAHLLHVIKRSKCRQHKDMIATHAISIKWYKAIKGNFANSLSKVRTDIRWGDILHDVKNTRILAERSNGDTTATDRYIYISVHKRDMNASDRKKLRTGSHCIVGSKRGCSSSLVVEEDVSVSPGATARRWRWIS